MEKTRYDFFENAYNKEFNKEQKGFINIDLKELLDSNDTTIYEIPLKFEYRPDLISKEFYGTHKYHWIITYFNDINNSPEGYKSRDKIRIPAFRKIYEEIM